MTNAPRFMSVFINHILEIKKCSECLPWCGRPWVFIISGDFSEKVVW
jgi:hypothetical protein